MSKGGHEEKEEEEEEKDGMERRTKAGNTATKKERKKERKEERTEERKKEVSVVEYRRRCLNLQSGGIWGSYTNGASLYHR